MFIIQSCNMHSICTIECQICTENVDINDTITCETCNQTHCKNCNKKMQHSERCPYCNKSIKSHELTNSTNTTINVSNSSMQFYDLTSTSSMAQNDIENNVNQSTIDISSGNSQIPNSDQFRDVYSYFVLVENITDILFAIFLFVIYFIY